MAHVLKWNSVGGPYGNVWLTREVDGGTVSVSQVREGANHTSRKSGKLSISR